MSEGGTPGGSEYLEVRGRLCAALARDLADSILSDSRGAARLAELLNEGVEGFSASSDLELLEAIFEAGLEGQNSDDVEKLIGFMADQSQDDQSAYRPY
jgi:hypothetical protein